MLDLYRQIYLAVWGNREFRQRNLFTLYDLENVAFPFIGLIDTRKKLTLIDEGLQEQGSADHKQIMERVHVLHDLRNVLAHSNFFKSDEGMDVDHINHQGKRWGGLGDKKRKEGNYLSFAELDRLAYSKSHRYGHNSASIIRHFRKPYRSTTAVQAPTIHHRLLPPPHL